MAKAPKSKNTKKAAIPELVEEDLDLDNTENEEQTFDEEGVEIPYEDEPDSALPVVYNAYDPSVIEAAEKSLRPSDPLKRYLHDIKNSPVLTVEQEHALTKRMHEQGDVSAAKLLVTANLKTVVRIAYEYRSMYHNLLDLIQEGNIGLMKAVSKFDPTKGARLGYYATWWIRSYILKYLLDNFRLIKVGTTQAQKKLFYCDTLS